MLTCGAGDAAPTVCGKGDHSSNRRQFCRKGLLLEWHCSCHVYQVTAPDPNRQASVCCVQADLAKLAKLVTSWQLGTLPDDLWDP
jgi:hypothetical protein